MRDFLISSLASKNTAAVLLAASLVDLFPGVVLHGGEATETCFYYDFSLPFVWQKDFLVTIQERMYALVRDRKEVKILEMIPGNAASFLKHYGKESRAHAALLQRKPLLSILQIGDFADYISEPYVTELSQLGAFALVEVVHYKNKLRIVGLIARDKQELKGQTKNYQPISGTDYSFFEKEYVAEFQGKEPGYLMWLPKGEAVRQNLLKFWRKKILENGYQQISTPQVYECTKSHLQAHSVLQVKKTAEVQYLVGEGEGLDLLSSKGFFVDRLHTFCYPGEIVKQCISCLQFIEQILTIFNFDYRFVLCAERSGQAQPKAVWQKNKDALQSALQSCGLSYGEDLNPQGYDGPGVEVRIADVFGKEHSCGFLYLETLEKAGSVIVHSLFGKMEHFFALLLEKTKGEIPFWLASPQVKVLALGENYLPRATQVQKEIESLDLSVDCEVVSEELSKKVYESLAREKVPYVLLYGEKEEQAGKVSVKKRGSLKQEAMDIQVLKQKLAEEKKGIEL